MLDPALQYEQAFSLTAGVSSKADHLESTLKQILVDGEVPSELSYLEKEIKGDFLFRSLNGHRPETYANHVFVLLLKENPDQAISCFEELTYQRLSKEVDAMLSFGTMLGSLGEYCKELKPAGPNCWDICDLAERYARTPTLVEENLREVLVAYLFGIASIVVPHDMPEWIKLLARLEDLSGVMDNRKLAGHFWFACAGFNENGYGEELDNYMMEVLQRLSPEFCAGFIKE